MTGCNFVESRIRALLDGELESSESRKVLAHLEECSGCRAEYARMQAVVGMLHEEELEDVPAHFSTSLQVRLSRHRRDRRRHPLSPGRLGELLARLLPSPPRLRLASGLTTAVVAIGLCAFASTRSINAAEVARRASVSWRNIHNYGCVFVSTGTYQGQPRTFKQRQFFRRPGEFRLDTARDYRLQTYVYQDRVVHYIPGADWNGRGPVVIVRPRREGQEALPFPFGVTWQNGGNVSLEQMVRQLTQSPDVEMTGSEWVGPRECYRMKFSATPPGGSRLDQYQVWIDKETYIPRRIHWYRDEQNHIVTEAVDLQVNYDVLPAGTFDFQIPDGAFVVHGDVDPHTLALPYVPKRSEEFDEKPVSTAHELAWSRADRVSFPVLAPEWLPADYRLMRVRARRGAWLDIHWLREGEKSSQVLKLVQQDAASEPPNDLANGSVISLETPEGTVEGRIVRLKEPYAQVYLTWKQGNTRLTLSAAHLPEEDVLRIAGSFVPARAPEPRVRIVRSMEDRSLLPGEPGFIPTETETQPATESPAPVLPVEPFIDMTQPAMMPEMPDAEPMPVPVAGSTP